MLDMFAIASAALTPLAHSTKTVLPESELELLTMQDALSSVR
ncbi:MAG: hypothetical protein ACOC0P_08055 [Planctomycetota bacterium]